MEYLLTHLKGLKERCQDTYLATCVNNAWLKLRDYWELTNNSHQIYALATLLHPGLRKCHFDLKWNREYEPWIPIIISNCEQVWKEYNTAHRPQAIALSKQDTLDAYLYGDTRPQQINNLDPFQQYYKAEPIHIVSTNNINFHTWWSGQHPALRQLAFDTLSTPAMSTECERVFSSAKKQVSSARNALKEDIIEATECLKSWWDNGTVKQEEW